MKRTKTVFFDRDGVLNQDRGDYTYEVSNFKIMPFVAESLKELDRAGYLLLVITNQAGISRGRYSLHEMDRCHHFLQEKTGNLITEFFYSPYHPTVTRSLSRKPGTLMFERAIAKYDVLAEHSWMIGDKERDLEPAKACGINTVQVGDEQGCRFADHIAINLAEATRLILNNQGS